MSGEIDFITAVSPEVEARTRQFYALTEHRFCSDDAVLALVKQGIAVDAKDIHGHMPLHRAVSRKSLLTCRELIRQKADVRAKTPFQEEPLHIAADHGHNDICLALIEAGADVNAPGNGRSTPLHYAAMYGHTDTCRLLLEHHADKYALDDHGNTVLHAAAHQDGDTCQFLLSQGLKPHALSNGLESTLHKAATSGAIGNCRLLLQAGVSVRGRNSNGQTPMHCAAIARREDICELFMTHGADIHAVNNEGQLSLHRSAIYGDIDTAELFLTHGVDINAQDAVKDTPFSLAVCKGGNAMTEEVLLARGANIHLNSVKLALEANSDIRRSISSAFNACNQAYTQFQTTARPPKNIAEFCRILSATPLADPDGPVDQQAHMRQIFSHARWVSGQAATLANALCKEHIVSAAFAEELVAIGRPQPRRSLPISR